MLLVLAVPGLLDLRDAGFAFDAAPSLARLLVAASITAREPGDLAAPLAALYGIARQSDWPLAPIRLAALGVDPGEAYWLAADPVTQVVGRDDVLVTGAVGDLGEAGANALIETLNAHFATDGLRFIAPRPDTFFVRAPTRPQLATQPLAAASGRSLRSLLPEGPDAGTWRRWQSEIQMLLHAHPVNIERERAARPPANSLWLSCGGTLPARPAHGASTRTFANTGIAVALAAHARSPAGPLPAQLDAALADARGAATVVVALESVPDAATLEGAWAAPAWRALVRGRLRRVSVLADGAGDSVTWDVGRPTFRARVAARVRRHDLGALLASGKAA